jgi:hypothetical protein
MASVGGLDLHDPAKQDGIETIVMNRHVTEQRLLAQEDRKKQKNSIVLKSLNLSLPGSSRKHNRKGEEEAS